MSLTDTQVEEALDAVPIITPLEICRLMAMEYIGKAQEEIKEALRLSIEDSVTTPLPPCETMDHLRKCIRLMNDWET